MAASVKAYFELMRLKNVALAAITVPLGAQFAMGDAWITSHLPEVILQTFAVVFFIGAGNTMNDIKDIDIDKEAHPNRPLASEAISLKNAKIFVKLLWALSILCLAVGIVLLHQNSDSWLEILLIYIVAITLMMTYDHGPALKNSGLVGNISISFMVGFVILYGAASVGQVWNSLVWWTAGVVFFTNLAREIVKDCQDIEADEGTRETLPMKIGLVKSRMTAYVFVMASLVCLYIPYWKGPFEFNEIIYQTPAILLLITLNKPMTLGEDYKAALTIRIAMLLGLVGFIVPMYI